MRLALFVCSLIAAFAPLKAAEWFQPQKDISKGNLTQLKLQSSILQNKRDVWVYTPVGYSKKNHPYPLLVVFDGQAYVSRLIPVPTILDNMIGLGYIPPLVAVFVSSIDQERRNRELPCDLPFVEFLAQELLPKLKRAFNITDDPKQTIVTGSSYGGLAAAYAGLRHPELFGNVLSQSGSFYWNDQWILNQFKSASKLPLRFYLDVGDRESGLLPINRYFCGILKTKGYPVYYAEFPGGHEYECWRSSFHIGLLALLGNKEVK